MAASRRCARRWCDVCSGQTIARSEVDAFRFGKSYTVPQAARLASVSLATVRGWLRGSDAPTRRMELVFGASAGRKGDPLVLSFLQLMEIVVVAQFRRGITGRRSLSLERLRRAHAFARRSWQGLEYPFASLHLKEMGGHVLHEFDETNPNGAALALDMGGQWAPPGFVTHTLESFDFSHVDRLAERWYPAGRDVPIVLDPHIGAGRMTIQGSGITVDTIYRRFRAGQTIEFLASDYDLDETAIEEAIRYADPTLLAAA